MRAATTAVVLSRKNTDILSLKALPSPRLRSLFSCSDGADMTTRPACGSACLQGKNKSLCNG